MAEATVVGRTRVSLIPDTSKFGDLLRVELPKAIRQPAIAAGDTAGDLISRQIQARLARLTPVVKVGVQVQAANARRQLDQLARNRTVTLTAQLDDRAATAGMRRLTQDRTVKVTAQLDERAATQSLNRLTADRTINIGLNLDETGTRQRLNSLLGQRTVDVLPQIQQAAYNTAQRQLDRLTADRVVNIRASVDTRVGAQEIRNLTQRRQVRIGVDVDTRVAADSLANLTRRRQMTVQARADTTAANGALTFLTRDRTVNVRVRSTGLAALTAGLGTLGDSSSGGGRGMTTLGRRIALIGTAALAALPSIVSLGSAIAQLGPLAATAAPALGLLIGGFAAIKVGLTGVSDAVKAAFQPVASEATKAASATRQVENAQRALARAQRSLQDAQRQSAERVAQANRQVADAERDLARAQRDARQAQQDLTDARRQAVRDLEDLNQRLQSGRLSEEEATLALQQAELDLQAARSDPTATQLQIQQAELAHQRAMQSLEEQRIEVARLEQDTAAANQAGVEGAQAVVQAKQQVAGVNEQIADRERALADAQRGIAEAQAEGQRDIANAQQAVADAARQVADAQQAAAAQTTKLDEAMAKLSPNARGFVNTLQAMAPAWRGMRLDVQDALFAGLGTRLQQVGGQILPTVRSGLVGATTELNRMGLSALGAVSNLERTGQLGQVFAGLRTNLATVSRIPGQLVTGFAGLSIAAQPAFDRIASGAASAMDRAMARLAEGLEDGSLTEAINTALDVAIQFGQVLGDLGGIFAGIFRAAGAAGGDFFAVIGAALAEIRRVIELPEMQAALTQVFKALSAVAALLAGALGAALQAVLPLLALLSPVVQQLATQLGPVIAQIFGGLATALTPIIQALLPIITDAVAIISDLAVLLLPVLQPIGQLISAILDAVAPLIAVVGEGLRVIVGALVSFLQPIITALIPAIRLFGTLFSQLAPLFVPLYEALTPLLPPLADLAVALIGLAVQVLTPLMPLIVQLAGLLTGLLTVALGQLVPIVNTVIGWLTRFVEAVTDAVEWVVDKFEWLFDVLLGHSIIPDIVRGAIDWFGRMWKRLKEIVTALKDGVVALFRSLKDGAAEIWRRFWTQVLSIAADAWKAVRDGVDSFGDKLKDAFRGIRDGIGTIWQRIQNLVKAPIRFWIETAYNRGIVSVWNRTAAKIPGVPDLKTMNLPKGFARGGILPGWSTWRQGDDQLVPMRRGEGVYVSEVMRDPYERQRLYAMNQAAMRGQHPAVARMQYGFAEGGILGAIGDIGSGIASGVGKALGKGADAVRGGLADLAEKAFKPVKNGLTKALGSNRNTFPGMIAAAPIGLIDKAIDYIRGKDIPPATGSWVKPVNAPYGTPFGKRGLMWASGRHTGLDFPAATGTKVVAVDSGTVQSVQSGGPYGKHVTVSHGGGLASLYAHMSAMVARAGDGIKQGAKIGSVGATGNVTGPHLHLEARVNGKTVDPMRYLAGGGEGGPGVQRWTGVVQQALGQLNQSMSLVSTTLRRMNQESGGNPRAVNRWDSNWQAGHPSVGLMQVIRGTFEAYAGKYRKTGPFMYGVSVDPMANIYASMRYALARYGSLSKAYNRPGGYAGGGIVGTRIHRGLRTGYASGGVITVAGKRVDTGPLAAAVGGDFLKQLTGTAAAIDSAMTKVANAVKNAFKGVKTTLDNKLLAQISGANRQLQALAKQRDAIAAKIAEANQFAADTTGQARQFTSLTGLPSGGNTFNASGILSGLTTRLTQLKKFGANIKILSERGLSKNLLQQIITAGPEQGAAYAQALVDATPKEFRQINTAQSAIDKTTTAFGKNAADAMFDAGTNSGKGYLTGLQSTQKLIEQQMVKLAKSIQKTIKVELDIKSPSRILRRLGRFTGLGYSQGVEETVPQARAAALRMAGAVRATAAASASRVQTSQTIRNGGDRHLHYSALVKEVASRKSVQDALAMDDMLNRTVVVG
jgi:SLT domain-containing protein/phage-related protein